MENTIKKRNNVSNILLTIAIILVLLLGGFIVYDKFLKKVEPETCPKCEEKECPTNEGETCNCQANTNSKCLVADIDYTQVFNNVKDYDGSYSSYYSINASDSSTGIHVYASIKMDGKIEFKIDGGKNHDGWYILDNINNAIDIIFDNGEGGLNSLYILCKNGDVYKYNVADYENKIKSATKVDSLKDIIKLVILKHCSTASAGCSGSLGAIDKNLKYKEIVSIY